MINYKIFLCSALFGVFSFQLTATELPPEAQNEEDSSSSEENEELDDILLIEPSEDPDAISDDDDDPSTGSGTDDDDDDPSTGSEADDDDDDPSTGSEADDDDDDPSTDSGTGTDSDQDLQASPGEIEPPTVANFNEEQADAYILGGKFNEGCTSSTNSTMALLMSPLIWLLRRRRL